MNRQWGVSWRSVGIIVVALAVVAAGARTTLGALSSDGTISACRNKSTGVLRVPKVWWEPGVRVTRQRRAALEEGVEKLAGWVGAASVDVSVGD